MSSDWQLSKADQFKALLSVCVRQGHDLEMDYTDRRAGAVERRAWTIQCQRCRRYVPHDVLDYPPTDYELGLTSRTEK